MQHLHLKQSFFFRVFDASQQPGAGLVSLTLDAPNPLEIIKCWSTDVRANLTTLDVGGYTIDNCLSENQVSELKAVVGLLPIRLSVSVEEVDYAPDLAKIGGKLEAMYINIYNSSLPTW
eukprot:5251476-Prymnesium_polylepis.1